MEVLRTLRHEFKYVMPYEDTLRLRMKLNDLLEIDRSESGYMIRSLYFDSLDDEDYYSKQNGDIDRKKIRLRIYEANPSKVKLEIKKKHDIHQLKESLVISVSDAKELIRGNYNILLNYEEEVAKEIYLILTLGNYKPKVIIEYQRIAYITGTTTRITFDYDIKRSYDFENYFDEFINYVPVVLKDDIVLEVKYDRFLEPYISDVINNYVTRSQSVSKYIMSRNF